MSFEAQWGAPYGDLERFMQPSDAFVVVGGVLAAVERQGGRQMLQECATTSSFSPQWQDHPKGGEKLSSAGISV